MKTIIAPTFQDCINSRTRCRGKAGSYRLKAWATDRREDYAHYLAMATEWDHNAMLWDKRLKAKDYA